MRSATGKYDWAHLAMHLWPERVVPKCAKDRSLAIAHGLEDVFWVEGTDGKWTARKTPTRSVDELVRERNLARGEVRAEEPARSARRHRQRRPRTWWSSHGHCCRRGRRRLMHPLHDYVAKQLADKLKTARVVVWYDERGEFQPFVDEVRGGPRAASEPGSGRPSAASSARLAEYAGSMFELRAVVEPHVSGDAPDVDRHLHAGLRARPTRRRC